MRPSRRSVIITRPFEQASAFAQRVAETGRQAVIFPLLEIHPLADKTALNLALARLNDFAMIAFVSPNAIAAAFALRPDWPAHIPLAVMGEGSRRALAEQGVDARVTAIFAPGDPERTDSETLLASLDLNALRGREVLILRGESGRELLADALRAAEVKVTQVAAYRRESPQFDVACQQQLAALLADEHLWIITSSEALRNLARMAENLMGAAGLARLQAQTLLVPHRRIAETANEFGLDKLFQCGSGDDHLFAALQSLS